MIEVSRRLKLRLHEGFKMGYSHNFGFKALMRLHQGFKMQVRLPLRFRMRYGKIALMWQLRPISQPSRDKNTVRSTLKIFPKRPFCRGMSIFWIHHCIPEVSWPI